MKPLNYATDRGPRPARDDRLLWPLATAVGSLPLAVVGDAASHAAAHMAAWAGHAVGLLTAVAYIAATGFGTGAALTRVISKSDVQGTVGLIRFTANAFLSLLVVGPFAYVLLRGGR